MNILVTIAARGGSKGVPGKNIRPLCGKPLIAHTIEQAKRWGRASHSVVSTDSDKIASVARDYGALVPFMRPAEMATDTADKFSVLRHATKTSEEIFQTTYDIIVDLDVTSPFRTVQDLENCLDIFTQKRPQALFSVVRAHKSPYFNMVEVDERGFASLSKRLATNIHRRQDAPVVYAMNASIYFYDRDFLIDPQSMSPISDRSVIYEMEEISSFDIDREIDFHYAEFLVTGGYFSL
ncbi:MAG: hypothetical protein A3I05_05010 [Deltaproteobacteria bacterium RIFCSPLOWO2_02_FULL_44_10]|nr:MAG: hypothetical protein A3C46_05770 [Deltaproteobacteria bacterium RIFCSPHIGHO2_02_FULL_44_16]OGQ45955.1 MAG: hypothetical protein A3I05_05010 [Deltaproteobacteria bacterium RIFCSPLOWO2_02_FULL_44_10]